MGIKHAAVPLGQVVIFIKRLDDFSSFYRKCKEGFGLLGTLDSLFFCWLLQALCYLASHCSDQVRESPHREQGKESLFPTMQVLPPGMMRKNEVK